MLNTKKYPSVELYDVEDREREEILDFNIIKKELKYKEGVLTVLLNVDFRRKDDLNDMIDFFEIYKEHYPCFVELVQEANYGS